MLKRFAIVVLGLMLMTLVFTLPALAGGWAVTTLDSLPAKVIAGQPVQIGFTIRQHGRTPFQVNQVEIRFIHPESAATYRVYAQSAGFPGHYSAEIRLDRPGTWRWGIASGLFPEYQPMPDLAVKEAPGTAATSSPRFIPPFLSLPILIGLAGLAGMAGALFVLMRSRSRESLALLGLAVLVAAAGFVSASSQANAARNPQMETGQAALGQDLFLAKGCVVCHSNGRLEAQVFNVSTEVGPDLTRYKADPDYIRTWLKDPAEVKPGTEMPNLELKEAEIEALAAFLNAGGEE